MVGAQQPRHHDEDVEGDDSECDGIPAREHELLELEIMLLAPRKDAAGITRLTDGSLDERTEITTAFELVLDPQSSLRTEVAGPLGVDLALEVECPALVGDVAGGDEEGKAEPEHECENGEERTVVEQDAGPSDEGCEDTEGGGHGGEDELGAVANTDDVSVGPDVEPCKEAEDKRHE